MLIDLPTASHLANAVFNAVFSIATPPNLQSTSSPYSAGCGWRSTGACGCAGREYRNSPIAIAAMPNRAMADALRMAGLETVLIYCLASVELADRLELET